MGDEIVAKEEQMEEEEATEDQVMFEFVAIKQEALSGDELDDEEVGNGERVEDEVAGEEVCSEVMGDEIVVKEEQVEEEEATEDQVIFEVETFKQEALSGDELVDKEVGENGGIENEVAGYPMIKQELESTDGSHSDGGDVLLGSIGVQRSEAGPSTAAASLPSYIKPCKRGSKLNQCSIINGNAAIPSFAKGDAKLKIPSLEPILVKELSVREDSAKSVALNLTFIDMKIKNLSKGKLVESKTDLNKRHIEWTIDVPKVVIDSQYIVNGKILVLPIRGNGPCHIELDNVKLFYVLDYKLNKVKGQDHAVITNTDLKFETEKLKLKLDNLFNGDKALSDNMNVVLNDNWQELLTQLGPPVAKAIALAVKPIVDKIVSQVPFDQIFPK
ncbi:hypothetical protein GE061_007884 [Apolygus lucorum]|uniref:Protein takeout n=1 Tax=Apolygus lucorum TaxID=248454 RepID=A0A8S9WN67_APOLU|nr:hypothetical protein GE061_007884 [Apolygus lucorum]